jgi:hypothetical protein
MRADIARDCFFAACYAQEIGQAKRWLLANPDALHDDYAAHCERVGNIVIK